jgi:hypothetical protein
MRPEEIPEGGGNCTSDHEVVNGHQLIYPGIEPLGCLLALTGRTMAVTARSENQIGIRAVFTGAYDGPKIRCPALDDCLYHLLVRAKHSLAKGIQIRFAVGKEHITHGHWRIQS